MIELIKNKSGEYKLAISKSIFKNGDSITGTIEDQRMEGKIRITNIGELFFCQNNRNGSRPHDNNLLGYSKSWVFKINNDKTSFTSGVSINYDLKDGFYINVLRIDSKFVYLTYNVVKGKREKEVRKKLFSFKQHFDCCGAMICYDFDKSNDKNYSLYKNVDIQILKDEIDKIKAAKIIHLASFQINAHNLMKKLDAKPIHKYINKNSQNEITIYQID